MKVVVFSHSHLEPENQKNIESLHKICVVHCIVPRFGAVNILKSKEFHVNAKSKKLFEPYFPFYITKAQYILFSLTLGLHKTKPDIINIEYNPWSAQFIQLLIARMFFSPQAALVCTIKKNTFIHTPGFLGILKNVAVKYTLGKVDHFIAVSQKAADMLEKKLNVPKQKISIAHQLGVDVDLFKPERKNVKCHPPFVVGYCGRLDADKGVSDLVDAMRLLNNSVEIPIQLKLLGNGAYWGFLDEHLKEESKKLDWIEILPGIPNDQVVKFLNELDVFVLPSRILEDHEEHDAHALMEALAVGIPCIGTKSGITPDILQNGTGIIVNSENINELSSEIQKLLKDHSLRQELSRRGRRKAETCFSLDVVAENKINIYTKVKNEKI